MARDLGADFGSSIRKPLPKEPVRRRVCPQTSVDNVDALAGMGLNLINLAYLNNNDKAKFQEGVNYLQKFVGVAPEGHKFKADAQALIDALKKEQNVTPQKVTAPPRKRP